ncbi:MAG: signal peptidase II [Candidatus Omnitrophica bacterium]|nr:signal peptidase II [Candidatus Omnitrophota bacterium]
MPGEKGEKIITSQAMIFIIVFPILCLDQLSKFIISGRLLLNESIPVIKGVLYFTLVHNRGAAFGLLKNQLPLFVFTAIVTVVLIYSNLKKHRLGGFSIYNVSLCLILAGALGNFIDRIIFGYVIDFLDFRVWPVFNLADSAITAGAVLLGYTLLFDKRKT